MKAFGRSVVGQRSVRRAMMVGSLVAALTCGVACEPPDWTDPEFLSQQIKEGDRLKALEEIPRLSEEDQKKVVPALVDAYNNGQDKDKVFTILAAVRDERAKAVYVDALKSARSQRDQAKAALALGELKATEHIPTMMDIFRNVPNQDLRSAIIQAFVEMPDAQEIPLLIDILKNYDPDREPISYHSYSCDILAAIDQPTDAVVDAVVYGIFLDNAKGQNVSRECSIAVATTGEMATEKLIGVMQGKNDAINTRFSKYKAYIKGSSEVTAVDTLGLLRAAKSAPAMQEEMLKAKSAPATYRNDKLLAWGQKRSEFFVAACGALGDMGAPESVEFLSKFVMPGDKDLESYKALIDYDKRTKLFMVEAAMKGLNAHGDRKGLEALGKAALKGDLPELKGYGPGAEYQSRWQAARAYAMLADAAHAAEFDKMASAEKNDDMKKKWAEFKPALDVASECKGDAKCYGKYLTDNSAVKSEKAAWELGRLPAGGEAEAQLLAQLGTQSPQLRTIIIKSLFRVGTKATADKIVELLDKESGKSMAEFKVLHMQMAALKAYIDNKG